MCYDCCSVVALSLNVSCALNCEITCCFVCVPDANVNCLESSNNVKFPTIFSRLTKNVLANNPSRVEKHLECNVLFLN